MIFDCIGKAMYYSCHLFTDFRPILHGSSCDLTLTKLFAFPFISIMYTLLTLGRLHLSTNFRILCRILEM